MLFSTTLKEYLLIEPLKVKNLQYVLLKDLSYADLVILCSMWGGGHQL